MQRRAIISVLLENESGVLSRVVGLFSQRGYNIETLTVAPTEDETLSRLTMTTGGDEAHIEQIIKQLYKIVEVVKVQDLAETEHIEREIMLIKVKATGAERDEIKRTADIFRGQIVDVTPDTYTVQVVRGDRRPGARSDVTNAANGSVTFDKPVANIGNKTIADYAAYAAQHMYNINIPGCGSPGRMFVGQRKESFVINVGETFDLLNIPPAVVTGQESGRANDLEGKNISTIALEVPIACLTQGSETVIGAWTTASVRQARIINPHTGRTTGGSKEGGSFAQVSRLSMPLVNEVVIGLKDKDRFNASAPDGDAQFLDYVTNPFLPAFIESVYTAQGVRAPTKFPRSDLVAVFLTGITGLNKPANVVPAEMMRLNTTFAPAAKGAQNRLGVIGGDTAGFPNGRRPGDDVVDIELRVVMGILCTLNQPLTYGCVPADAPSGAIPFTDGAFTSDARFDAVFPYLTTPLRGSPQPQNTP